jgi:hypothetical protein
LNEDLAALRIIDNDDVSVDFVPRRRFCGEIFRFDPVRGGAELVGELAYRRHIEFLHGLPESRDENRQTHVEHRARERIAAWNGRERALAFLKDRSARPSVAHDRRFDLAIVGVDKSHSGDGCECLDSPTLHQCSVFIMAAGAHLTPSLMSALRLCPWDAVLAASDPVWSGFALGVCGFTPSLSRTDAAAWNRGMTTIFFTIFRGSPMLAPEMIAACGVCGVLGVKSQNGYGEKRKPVSIYLILSGLI